MTYSARNRAWGNQQKGQERHLRDEEASYIEALTKAYPELSRYEIRMEAARLARNSTVWGSRPKTILGIDDSAIA